MNIIADTCFWISLCDPKEHNHMEVVSMMERIVSGRTHRILVPHPVLYETLRTEMVKKPPQVRELTRYFAQVDKVSDVSYVNEALRVIEQQADFNKGTASMVDIAIMLMAKDARNNVKAILTQNGRDFDSFCRNCGLYRIDSLALLESI